MAAVVQSCPHFSSATRTLAFSGLDRRRIVAAMSRFSPDLSSEQVARAIDEFEARVRTRQPDAKWMFVEPDLTA